jgi:hypothetical protein
VLPRFERQRVAGVTSAEQRCATFLFFPSVCSYLRGVITEVMHDPGRGAPLMTVRFRNPYKNRKDDETIVAPEGIYTGQSLYFGKKAVLAVGNVLPVSAMPEGTIICNVERYPGDRGKLAKVSGEYCTIIGHNEDTGLTKIRMPSGSKKNIAAECRGMVRRSRCNWDTDPFWECGDRPEATLVARALLAYLLCSLQRGCRVICALLSLIFVPLDCRSVWSPAVAVPRSPCSRPVAPSTSSPPSVTSGPRCAVWP